MEFHQIASIFPLLEDDDLQALVSDIRANGLREPVVMYEGKILDGRNRWTACGMAGVKPKTREFTGSHQEAVAFVWSENARRRHLNPSQISIAEAKRAKFDAEYAAEVAKMARPKGRPSATENGQRIAHLSASQASIAESKRHRDESARTTAKRAASINTNRTYVAVADKIVAEAPELAEQIEKGHKTIPQAKRELDRRKRTEEQKERAEKAKQFEDDQPLWTLIQQDVIDGLESVCDHHSRPTLIFADPPYNIGIDYGGGSKADKLPSEQYMLWVSEWVELARDLLSDDGTLWLMIGDEYAAEYAVTIKRLGLTIRSWVKWYETFGVNCSNNFNRCSRHLFYCVKDHKRFTFNPEAVTRPSDRQTKYGDKRAAEGGKIWDDVWQIPRLVGTSRERIAEFPTQLPLDLVRPIVAACSNPGELVVDPFSGSGTTGAACIELGRKYIGIDKSEKFIDLSTTRLKAVQFEVFRTRVG